MIWIYKILDTVTTITEAVSIYICILGVCREIKFHGENKLKFFFPPAFMVFLIYLFTWYIDIGAYKPIVTTFCLAVAAAICHKISMIRTIIPSMLGLIFILVLDSAGLAAYYLLSGGESVTVAVDGKLLMTWQVYVIGLVMRIVLALFLYRFFSGFSYTFNGKDLFLVLFDVGIVSWVYIFNYDDFFAGNPQFFVFMQHLIFIVLSAGVVLPVFYLKNYYYLREKTKQDQIQIAQLEARYAYYQDKMKEEERIRSIYHDLKNHLLILQEQAEKSQEVQDSILELKKQVEGYENYYRTGNEFLDIIIRDKARAARERQIDMSAVVHFEEGFFIEPLDISTIFGNALDNAIEASEKLPEEERVVIVKAGRIRDMLVVSVENKTTEEEAYVTAGRTDKPDSFLHGFGLANMKKAVEKYDGQCTTKLSGGVFALKIMIPIP